MGIKKLTRNGTRLLAIATVLTAPTALAQSVVNGGNARGQVTQSLNTGGVALLSSFDFDFGFGNDHQIARVKVLPSENSTSVSVAYNDKNSDDAYNYQAGFWGSYPQNTFTYTKSGSCRGMCSLPFNLPAGYTFVIRGFSLQFASSDHHIKTIGIDQSGDALKIHFADKNSDDLFYYTLHYALVGNSALTNYNTLSGSGVNSASATLPYGRHVLLGFMLNFSGTDHHISKIRVAPAGSNLSVIYRDKNGDDSFSWRVKTASLR